MINNRARGLKGKIKRCKCCGNLTKSKKEELGISDGTKKGMLMSALMKDLKGKADGGMVKKAVDSLFS